MGKIKSYRKRYWRYHIEPTKCTEAGNFEYYTLKKRDAFKLGKKIFGDYFRVFDLKKEVYIEKKRGRI